MSDRHFQRAYSTHMSGDKQAARDLYERILKKTPKHVDARYMLGTLLAESGELELALTHLKAAATRMPHSPMIHTNLGNVYLKLGKLDQASDCYQRSLKLDPLVPETLFNLGAIFHQQGKLEEAASHIESSLGIKPNFPAAYFKLSKIYREQDHPDLAAACFIKVLAIDSDSIEALLELGNIYAAIKDYANAAFYFKRMLEIDPNNDSARHAVAALSGETTATAPATHVEQLFDELSGSFDSHLEQLGYRVPEMLKEMLVALAGEQSRFDRAIDLGCGTGLSGVQFRAMVTHLTGLDLSQKMVEIARAKGIYDELAKGDISQYLGSSQQQYDLFIATDVFIYLGKLTGFFTAARAHARTDAYLVFSTEVVLEQEYILRPSGRYAHSRNYIETLAHTHGFSIAASRSTDLRMEGQQPVKGELFVLKLDRHD